jgi:two-component system cell cycle sensor histidine kinase/response regulator CckA
MPRQPLLSYFAGTVQKLSLKNKMLLSILFVILLIIVSVSIILRWALVPSLTSELTRRGVGIAQSIAERGSGLVLTDDEAGLTSLVFDARELSARREFVSYALILDRDQEVLAHTFIGEFPQDIVGANNVSPHETNSIKLLSQLAVPVYDVAVPVVEGIKRIGTVRLGLSKRFIDGLVKRIAALSFLGFSVVICLAFFVSKWVSEYITRHISELTRLTTEVSQGNLDVSFDVGERVECWKILSCDRVDCPVFEKIDTRCWMVPGTLCAGVSMGAFPQKLTECRSCPVYKSHAGDEIVELSDSFSHMVGELKKSQQEVQTARDGLEHRVKERTSEIVVANEQLKREIDERKQAQDALRRIQAQQQAILDASIDMIMQIDDRMRIVWANRMAARVVDKTPDYLMGRTCHQLFQNSDRPCTGCPCVAAFKTGNIENATMHFAALGTVGESYWEIYGVPLRDESGHLAGVIQIGRDVTEKTRVEQGMTRAKEDWEKTFDAITDMVMLLDSQHRILRANKATAEVLRTSKEQLVGKKCYEVIHRKKRPIAQCPLVHTMERLAPHTKDITEPNIGGVFICSTSPIIDEEGRLKGYTHTLKDVTKARELETRLQEVLRLESLGTLAGGIAHDFNNLLMAVQGNASLMLLHTDSSDPHYKRLRSIEKQVESGVNLTRQLLGYARKGRYEVGILDLNEIVIETSETFGRTRKNVTVIRDLAGDLRALEADKGQIEQVLLNLYVNAADAMPAGGVLTLETMNVSHKSLTGQKFDPQSGEYVLLRVSDNGVGMDRQTMARVFEPFFTTKAMGRGTGLGLASVYGIVKGHGGYIYVESEQGVGTIFSLYLPASDKVALRSAKAPPVLTKGSGTILLVDDEADVLNVGKDLLEAMGFRVLTAADGREAVEIYEGHCDEIDLVLLDMVMPRMGGGEAYDRLKAINPAVRVLLSSGFSIDGEAGKIMQRGCDGFIQKPFTLGILQEKMKEILKEA